MNKTDRAARGCDNGRRFFLKGTAALGTLGALGALGSGPCGLLRPAQ
ncbi:twin-arginine translocation signal domain-containing protein, partial [Desulfovibrio sp. XJ01]|nr:twin-arginine translocation signal domain-containing protein [Nitratidesulfovibrio liaohensis]